MTLPRVPVTKPAVINSPCVKIGDIVIVSKAGILGCSAVLVVQDGIVPDAEGYAESIVEALTRARELTAHNRATIWKQGPSGEALVKLV